MTVNTNENFCPRVGYFACCLLAALFSRFCFCETNTAIATLEMANNATALPSP